MADLLSQKLDPFLFDSEAIVALSHKMFIIQGVRRTAFINVIGERGRNISSLSSIV